KAEQLAATHRTTGMPALDEWERVQAGMRADWQLARDSFTLQADIYEGESQDRGTFAGFDFGAVTIAGANVLGRWSRPLGRSELEVQAFFDHAERDDSLFFRPKADTFDVEVHHAVAFGAHDVLWGGGYRRSKDEIGTGFTTTFIPPARAGPHYDHEQPRAHDGPQARAQRLHRHGVSAEPAARLAAERQAGSMDGAVARRAGAVAVRPRRVLPRIAAVLRRRRAELRL